jgi:nucleoid-associated protein YgaU
MATVDLDWPIAPAPAHARYLVANPQGRVVVVRPGDSLWAIAQRHLPPRASAEQIAAAWPRWYAANRRLIGPNPDLLLPGQRLTPPQDTPPLDTPPVDTPGGPP